jgi:TusA-related sulfurtransferase
MTTLAEARPTEQAGPAITRTVDARGSFCPGPLMELIRAIRESTVGDVIAVRSSDSGSKVDIPKWIEKAGHRLVSLEARDGYDEIVVEKVR